MQKQIILSKNSVIMTGNLVADANITAGGACFFRMAHNGGKDAAGNDRPSSFFDVVTFPGDENPVPVNALKKGAKVYVQGYFRTRTNEKDGKIYNNLEIVATKCVENKPVTVDVPDEPGGSYTYTE